MVSESEMLGGGIMISVEGREVTMQGLVELIRSQEHTDAVIEGLAVEAIMVSFFLRESPDGDWVRAYAKAEYAEDTVEWVSHVTLKEFESALWGLSLCIPHDITVPRDARKVIEFLLSCTVARVPGFAAGLAVAVLGSGLLEFDRNFRALGAAGFVTSSAPFDGSAAWGKICRVSEERGSGWFGVDAGGCPFTDQKVGCWSDVVEMAFDAGRLDEVRQMFFAVASGAPSRISWWIYQDPAEEWEKLEFAAKAIR